MQPNPIQRAQARFGLKPSELAKLLGVTQRAVYYWLRGTRTVPGPVEAYLRLLGEVPQECRHVELRKILGCDYADRITKAIEQKACLCG